MTHQSCHGLLAVKCDDDFQTCVPGIVAFINKRIEPRIFFLFFSFVWTTLVDSDSLNFFRPKPFAGEGNTLASAHSHALADKMGHFKNN